MHSTFHHYEEEDNGGDADYVVWVKYADNADDDDANYDVDDDMILAGGTYAPGASMSLHP